MASFEDQDQSQYDQTQDQAADTSLNHQEPIDVSYPPQEQENQQQAQQQYYEAAYTQSQPDQAQQQYHDPAYTQSQPNQAQQQYADPAYTQSQPNQAQPPLQPRQYQNQSPQNYPYQPQSPQMRPTQPMQFPPQSPQMRPTQPMQFPPQSPQMRPTQPMQFPPQSPQMRPTQPMQYQPQSPQMNHYPPQSPQVQPGPYPPQSPQKIQMTYPPNMGQGNPSSYVDQQTYPQGTYQTQNQGAQYHHQPNGAYTTGGAPPSPYGGGGGGVVGVGVPVPVPRADGWKTGLFDCMDDPENALVTAFFPCLTFGQIAEIVDEGHTTCGTSGLIYGAVMSFTYFPCILSCGYRTKLRSKFGLAESPAPDWITHLLFEHCALCQEYRELQLRGWDPTLGWQENVNKMQQPPQPNAMVPPMNQTMMA